MFNFLELKKLLIKYDKFIITCHVNPDADALGSELAMYYILKKLDKKVRIINYSQTPENLLFLDKNNVIETYEKSLHDEIILDSDVVIFLDLNAISRTKTMFEVFNTFDKIKICIDHHEYPENFTPYIISKTESCATGEIIYDFINDSKICAIDYDIAFCLYAAIMTDTGSFRFDRTSSKTHRIVAEFLDMGINPNEIYTEIYEKSNFGKIKLLGLMLSELKLNEHKNVCYFVISQKMIDDYGVDESEVDGFVNHTLTIKGVKIGLLFIELNDGFKVSLRSRGKIPVNLLAKKYGGGGHLNASGIRMLAKSVDDYINLIVHDAEELIKNSGE
jgi:phosphoesterase RecJ-like protein